MTTKERILLFLNESKIRKNDFFTDTGIASSNFKGVAMNSELGSDKIVKILTLYPDLSSDWLLLGREPMLRNAEKKESRQELYTNTNESILYKMYKEEREETGKLKEEIGSLKERIRQLEGGDAFVGKFTEASTSNCLEQSEKSAVIVKSTTKYVSEH